MIRLMTYWAAALGLLVGTGAPADAQRADTLALSLGEAVSLALRAGDEVREAQAQIDVTEAQVRQARAGVFPQLRLNSSYQRVFESARGQAVGRFFNQPNTYSTYLNLSQTLFQGGREFAAPRAASRLRSAARLDAAEARAQLSLDVQRAYLQALYTDRLLDIQRANYELAAERLSQVERFQNAGRSARYDVLRARVERANLEPLVIQARGERDVALLELKRLLNVPMERPVALTTSIDAGSVQTMLASLAADSAAEAERPSVRAAELVARARRDAITVARADYFPTISAFVQGGYQAFPLGGFPTERGRVIAVPTTCPAGSPADSVCTRNQSNGGWFRDAFAGITVSWPLFDGLRTRSNVELARAEARLAQIQLAQERETVALEVAQAQAVLAGARALFAARQQNATEADEAFRLASLRFTRGVGTQLDVSDAQLALLTARTDQARAVYDLYLASAELARALGRPIPLPPADAPAPTRTTLKTGIRAEPANP